MKSYDLRFKIKAKYPDELTLADKVPEMHLINDKSEGIQVISIDKNRFTAIVSVVVQAADLHKSIPIGAEKLNRHLDFYSVFSYQDMEIDDSFDNPYLIIDLDRKKEIQGPLTMAFGFHYPPHWVEKFISEFKPTVSKRGNEYLSLALNFMRNSRLSKTSESRILNCFVVLESLYSKNEERTEMTYRISNRMSTLLAEDKKERIKLLKRIRELYVTRSLIVHGSSAGKKVDEWYITPLTRESIMRFLKLSKIYSS